MALCRIIADCGIKVAPFKAQNVPNNSAVGVEGGEISRAQCLQAEAARVPSSCRFNPLLLKSQGSRSVQVVVNGQVYHNQNIAAYFDQVGLLQDFDLDVVEGAGSPVELNQLDKDLSNTFIAKTFNTQNILVADDVFARRLFQGYQSALSRLFLRSVSGMEIQGFAGMVAAHIDVQGILAALR